MTGKFGTIRTIAASLVLASASIFGTAASATYDWSHPNCSQLVYEECTTQWSAWGYRNLADCQRLEPCYYCLYGYLCGYSDYWAPGKPRDG
jgi:hypothetical protein